jgi:hypothetical protein
MDNLLWTWSKKRPEQKKLDKAATHEIAKALLAFGAQPYAHQVLIKENLERGYNLGNGSSPALQEIDNMARDLAKLAETNQKATFVYRVG